MPIQLDSIEHARKLHNTAQTLRSHLYGKPGYEKALAEEQEIETEAWRLFGDKIQVTDRECPSCRVYSIFGGPSHNPSPMCRSGKRPHCTCDACW